MGTRTSKENIARFHSSIPYDAYHLSIEREIALLCSDEIVELSPPKTVPAEEKWQLPLPVFHIGPIVVKLKLFFLMNSSFLLGA